MTEPYDLAAYDAPLPPTAAGPASTRPLEPHDSARPLEPTSNRRPAGSFPIRLSPATAGRMKAWRRRAGLTQAELAERVGVGRSFIAKLEQARQAPGVRTVDKIGEALDLSKVEVEQLRAESVAEVTAR